MARKLADFTHMEEIHVYAAASKNKSKLHLEGNNLCLEKYRESKYGTPVINI